MEQKTKRKQSQPEADQPRAGAKKSGWEISDIFFGKAEEVFKNIRLFLTEKKLTKISEAEKKAIEDVRTRLARLYGGPPSRGFGEAREIGEIREIRGERKEDALMKKISAEAEEQKEEKKESEAVFVPLSEIAKNSSYSKNYINYSARQGRLKAKKIGGVWHTTEEWLAEFTKNSQAQKNRFKEKLSRDLGGSKKFVGIRNGGSTSIMEVEPPRMRKGIWTFLRLNLKNIRKWFSELGEMESAKDFVKLRNAKLADFWKPDYAKPALAMVALVFLIAFANITKADLGYWGDWGKKEAYLSFNRGVDAAAKVAGAVSDGAEHSVAKLKVGKEKFVQIAEDLVGRKKVDDFEKKTGLALKGNQGDKENLVEQEQGGAVLGEETGGGNLGNLGNQGDRGGRVLAAATGAAQTNIGDIEVSAYLMDASNKEIPNGEYDVRFGIYTADRTEADPYPSDADKGSRVWEETQKVQVENGLFRTYLGATAPIPANFNFAASNYYIGIRVGEDAEMVPRKRIGAVPLARTAMNIAGQAIGNGAGNIPLSNGALNANLNADLLDGLHSTAFQVAGSYQPAGTYDNYVSWKLQTAATDAGQKIKANKGAIFTGASGIVTSRNLNTLTISPTYGSEANTIAQGSTVIAVDTTGNLQGGGSGTAGGGVSLTLDTVASPTFTNVTAGGNLNLTASANLIFGGATSLGETTAPTDSGAYLVGAADEFTVSASTNVQGVLKDLDTAIGGGGGGLWTLAGGTISPTDNTNSLAVGTASQFQVTNVGAVTAGTYNGNTITAGTGTLTLNANTLTLTGSSQINQNLLTTSAPTFATLNTGQGANELYAMDQNVRTGDSPSFTGLTVSGLTPNYPVITGLGGVLATEQYLDVTRGGTGVGTFTQYGVLYGNLAADLQVTAAGAEGQVLKSHLGSAPTWEDIGAAGSVAWSGITDPTGNLSLSMAARTTTFTWNAATGASNLFNFADTAANTGTGYLLNIATGAGSTLKPLRISAAGTEALTVTAGGNVGIGTTSPSAKLDVESGSGNDTLYLGNNNGVLRFYNDGSSHLARVSGATTFYISSGWTTVGLPGLASSSGSTDFTSNLRIYNSKKIETYSGNGTGQNGVWDATTGAMALGYANQGTAQLAINGNVGIGTTTPTYKLDISDGATTRGLNIANSTALSYGLYSVGVKYGAYGSDGTTSGYLGYDDTYGLYTASNAYVEGNLSGIDSLTATTGNFTTVDLGTNTITDGNLTGGWSFNAGAITNVASLDTITTSSTALTFTSTAPTISVSTAATAINLNAGTTGEINIGSVSSGNVNIAAQGTGNILLAGGSGSTGCTVTNSNGDLVCSGNITGGGTGTIGYWTRTGTTLSPQTAGDKVAVIANGTNTSGTLFRVYYSAAATLAGALIGADVDLNDGNVTPTNQNVTGLRVVLPTTTNTNLVGTTITYNGMSLGYGVGTGINQNGAGATVYNGANLPMPALTQTLGSLTANGALITTSSSITTGGTANGINIDGTGVGAGSLNGIYIDAITGSTGTERAIAVGSGWDAVLTVNGNTVVNGSGVVPATAGGTGLTSYAAGDMIYASGANTLANLVAGVGNNGKVLVVSGGVPTWGVMAGSSCTDCVLNDPTAVATQTITPNNQDISSLVVRKTTFAVPTQNIFEVTSADGLTKYFYVDKDGNVSTGGTASQTLTLTPASNTTALTLVGTNVTTASLQYINSKNTQGTIFNMAYGAIQTLTGALIGESLNLATNVTATDQSVTGISITLPTPTNTTSASNYKGLVVTGPGGAGINQNGVGTTVFSGVDVTIPALTQTAGSLTANGVNVATPATITTGGTANGISISATGVGAGTLRGIYVSNITAGAGAETAIRTGTGWDYAAIFEAGNVGIGTTTPAQKLHVEGQCVTGDTLLAIVDEDTEKSSTLRNSESFARGRKKSNFRRIANGDSKSGFSLPANKSPEFLKAGLSARRIDEVKGGEYVMSLDEKTGKLVPARIKGLLDMGTKPIFKITTEDGRTIRTTGNHPYLAKENNKNSAETTESLASTNQVRNPELPLQYNNTIRNEKSVKSPQGRGPEGNRTPGLWSGNSKPAPSQAHDENIIPQNAQWTKVAELEEGDEIAVAEESLLPSGKDDQEDGGDSYKSPEKIKFVHKIENLKTKNRQESFLFGSEYGKQSESYQNQSADNIEIKKSLFNSVHSERLSTPSVGEGHDNQGDCQQSDDNINVCHSAVENENYFSPLKNKKNDQRRTEMVNPESTNAQLGEDLNSGSMNADAKTTWEMSRDIPDNVSVLDREHSMSSSKYNESETDVKWKKIARIELLPPEQVFDIEVEGTHNFVANGIVAHNTYINGNLGIGDSSPASPLTVGSGDLFQVNSSGNIVKLNNVTTSFPASQGALGSVLTNSDGAGTLTWASPSGSGIIGYWTRTGTILSPATAGDIVSISTNAAGSPALALTSSAITATGAAAFSNTATFSGSAAAETYYGQKLSITNNQTVNADTLYGQHISFTDAGLLANTLTGLYVDATTANANDIAYAAVLMGGNVGIGTTTPAATLNVAGTSLITGNFPWTGLNSTVWGATTYIQNNLTATGAGTGNYTGFQNPAGKGFFFSSASVGTMMTLDVGGNVGIGTTTPSSILTVKAASGAVNLTSTTGTNPVVFSATNTGGTLYMGREDSASGTFGQAAYASVVFSSGAYPLVFGTNNAGRMTIDSGGNVGIGTTTPGARLQVLDAVAGGMSTQTLGYFNSTSNAYTTGKLLNVDLTQSAATGTGVSGNIASLSFNPTYSTAIVTPAITGNVLNVSRTSVTNTDFASTLTVSGAVAYFSDSATQTQGTLTSTADVVQIIQNYGANTGAALNVASAGSFVFRANDNGTFTDSTPFVIDGGGNVGIGITTPNELLAVNGRISLAETTAPSNVAGWGKLYVKSANSRVWFMDDSGVEYDLTAASYWTRTGTTLSPTTAGDDLYLQSNELLGVGYDPSTISGGVAAFNGNVGIGTATPGAKLHVVSTATADANVYGLYNDFTSTQTLGADRSSYATYNKLTFQPTPGVNNAYGYADYNYAYIAGSYSANTIYGAYNGATKDSSGTLTNMYGAYNTATTANTGAVAGLYGARNEANASWGAAVTEATGSINVLNVTSNATSVTTGYGSYNYASLAANGASLGTAYGSYNRVNKSDSGTGTITLAYGVSSTLTKGGSASQYGTGYLFYGSMTATDFSSAAWGLYITGETKNYISGNVGIGTTTPIGKLHVTTGAWAASSYGIYSYMQPTDSSYNNSKALFAYSYSTNSSGQLSSVYAGDFYTIAGATGTGTTWNAYGVNSSVRTNSAGTVNRLIAFGGGLVQDASTGTVSYGNIFYSGASVGASATMSDLRHVEITDAGGTGTVTTQYGLYIANLTKGGTNFSIYSGTAKSYFGGNVGIGTTTPDQVLDVVGRIQMSTWTADGDTVVYKDDPTGNLGVQASDARLKKNIKVIGNALDIVQKIRGVTFNWKDDPAGKRPIVGVVAQDVAAVMPELTFGITDPGGNKYLGVHYDKLTPVLFEAVKEQQTQISQSSTLGEANSRTLGELNLKITENKTDVSSLQTAVNDKFNLISNSLISLNSQITQIPDIKTRLAAAETKLLTAENNLATFESSTNDTITAMLETENLLTQRITDHESRLAALEAKISAMTITAGEIPSNVVTADAGGNAKLAGIFEAKGVVAGSVDTKKIKLGDQTSGKETLAAGKTEKVIPTTEASADAKIYVTPLGKLSSRSLFVDMSKVKAGESFTVELDGDPLTGDLDFNWLIVK